MCGVTHVTVAALFCSSSLLCTSNCDWATENEAGRSVSVNGNEEPAGEICHQYSSVVTAVIPYSHTIKLQYTLLRDYWECVRPARLPVLTWVPSSVPPGNNIQDTFLIRSSTDATLHYTYSYRLSAIICTYNTRSWTTSLDQICDTFYRFFTEELPNF